MVVRGSSTRLRVHFRMFWTLQSYAATRNQRGFNETHSVLTLKRLPNSTSRGNLLGADSAETRPPAGTATGLPPERRLSQLQVLLHQAVLQEVNLAGSTNGTVGSLYMLSTSRANTTRRAKNSLD